jgi:peptidoglycan L-alanyl-D-glutamate endopeptidase CwlK
MSSRLFTEDVLFTQRLLSSCGLYHGALDGKFGVGTKAAEDAFELLFLSNQKLFGMFDLRSEGNIATLMPKMQVAARKILALAKKQFPAWTVQVLSGTRTYAEQNVLFNQRPRVTKARGGQSNHNFGIAIDVGIFVNGHYYTGANAKEEKAYADLAKAVKAEYGPKGRTPLVEWGGDWKSIHDEPHYQLITGKSVSECRVALEAGKSYA